MTAAAFGVSSLVAISANFVVWIKWLGVIYLLWLGLKLILRRDPLDIVQAVLWNLLGTYISRVALHRSATRLRWCFCSAVSAVYRPGGRYFTAAYRFGGTYLLIDGVIMISWGGIALRATFGLRRGPARLVAKLCGGLIIGVVILLGIKNFWTGPELNRTRTEPWRKVTACAAVWAYYRETWAWLWVD
jgi:homoserine/homoserine lactone efflux protein